MRLCVVCEYGHRTYLAVGKKVNTRKEIINELGSRCFDIECCKCRRVYTYDVNSIFAESVVDVELILISMGMIGLLLLSVPIFNGKGFFIGLFFSGIFGVIFSVIERNRVKRFNLDIR